MPFSKRNPYLADDRTRHRTLFVVAAILVAGLCSLSPQGIFRDYDAKERRKQDDSIRDLDTRKWQREQEDRHHEENPSSEDDEPLPSRKVRYHSSRDGRSMPPPPSRDRDRDGDMQNPEAQQFHRPSHHHERPHRREKKDPFS